MSDSVEILASGAHANVATTYSGVTPMLTGWRNGTVPLESQQKSSGVDVSMYSTLKVDLVVESMTNRGGYENGTLGQAVLHVALEHLVDGSWQLLHKFPPMKDPVAAPRAILTGFGEQVRASWFYARSDMPSTITDAVSMSFSVTADALPETA